MTEETVQARLDKESLKKVREMLEEIDFDKIMNFLVEMLAIFGELSVKLGEIEEENENVLEVLKTISLNPKLFLSKMIEKASAEEVKSLMRAMLRFDELSPKISNLFNLSAKEKKAVGEELINLSKEIEEAYKKARKKN